MTWMLKQGDALNVLREMGDNFTHSIVCDPPYGLKFMGKKWDAGLPDPEIWKECLRVLKPGGFMFAFSGTRTYHRLAVAVEDAGFIIHPMFGWIYGCLSEDTEILTKNGWKHYHKSIEDEDVLCYTPGKQSFHFEKPTRSFCYENEHPAYRIESDFTSQLVSRNHRCLVERDGREVFIRAEALESEETVPFLESLSDLPESLFSEECEGVSRKKDVFSKMWKQNDRDKKEGENHKSGTMSRKDSNNMSGLREKSMEKPSVDQTSKNPDMLQKMQWPTSIQRISEAFTQGKEKLARIRQKILFQENVRPEQPSMERRGYQKTIKGKLWFRYLCEMPCRIFNYGEERRLCYATPISDGAIFETPPEKNGSSASQRSQSSQQFFGKSDAFSKQPRTQVVRSTRAKVTKVEYKGKVWCVQVSSGAFVARRKGKIFITGNSGFPKGADLSKAIDKKLGVTRKIVGVGKGRTGDAAQPHGGSLHSDDNYQWPGEFNVTMSGSEEGQKWEGWKYGLQALKPALEPILLAQKPFEGKPVDSIRKHEVGAFNIDACRIAHNEECREMKDQPNYGKFYGQGGRHGATLELKPEGRYPANLLLDGEHLGDESRFFPVIEVCPFMYQAKASKRERNEGLDHLESKFSATMGDGIGQREHNPEEKSAYVKNIHPTVKPVELMRWLIKLVTRDGQLVLDPFAGSGTTGIACIQEGRDFIGIELDLEYWKIATERLDYWEKKHGTTK